MLNNKKRAIEKRAKTIKKSHSLIKRALKYAQFSTVHDGESDGA